MSETKPHSEHGPPNWQPSVLLSDAFGDACRWHKTQARKVSGVPYITHLMGASRHS